MADPLEFTFIVRSKTKVHVSGNPKQPMTRADATHAAARELRAYLDGHAEADRDPGMRAELWHVAPDGAWQECLGKVEPLPPHTATGPKISVLPLSPADAEVVADAGADPRALCTIYVNPEVTDADVAADTVTITLKVTIPKSLLRRPPTSKLGLLPLKSAFFGPPLLVLTAQRQLLADGVIRDG